MVNIINSPNPQNNKISLLRLEVLCLLKLKVVYFIIECSSQLSKLSPKESGFVQVIPLNDQYHPKLTNTSLIYYNDFDKGYIFSIDHSESMGLTIDEIQEFLSSHKNIYLFDKKYHSYFLDFSNAIDMQLVAMNQFGKFDQTECNTSLHNDFYQKYGDDPQINKIIPISKHYQKCECFFEKANHLIGLETDYVIEDSIAEAYKYVEEAGIGVEHESFKAKFKTQNDAYSIKQSTIYGFYNLYNTTGRPTNAFNGVNFLAMPKEEDFRKCFIPNNDLFVEFDFDAYHLRIISKLVDYKCPKESMHQYLGKKYFNKEELTDEEYSKSKEITFRQLYGGIEDQYKNIEFFSKLDSFIDKEWKKYNKFGAILLPTGRKIKKAEGMNKLRLFNYIIQNLETVNNVDRIQKIKKLLETKKTRLVLITYDSFLFDFSINDGKQTLEELRDILQGEEFIVKHKYAKNYNL
jgi:hypothetical protein